MNKIIKIILPFFSIYFLILSCVFAAILPASPPGTLGEAIGARTTALDSCSNPITQCCIMNQNIVYSLANDISATGDCMIIEQADANLDCNDHTITGDGTGIGVNITNTPPAAFPTIIECKIKNFEAGILVDEDGKCIIGSGNVISDNFWGVLLYSNDNFIINSYITDNTVGVQPDTGWYNSIYNNYFCNLYNGYTPNNEPNYWNTTKSTGPNIIGGPYIAGNYWSDYDGEDTDGDRIGETPYTVFGGTNKDYLPLIGNWVSPTGHEDPDNEWDDEFQAYDEDTASYAIQSMVGSYSWSSSLNLTLGSAITSNKVRFYAYMDKFDVYDRVWLEVKRDGSWVEVYKGDFENDVWQEKTFIEGSVDQARIRLYNREGIPFIAAYLFEFDFWAVEAPEAPPTTTTTTSTTTTTIRRTGGGCPTLFVYDGNDYVEERISNLHSQEGVNTVDEIVLTVKPAVVDGYYRLMLREIFFPGHSHIDSVKLSVDGEEVELISAEHSKYGDVTEVLIESDDVRTDTKLWDEIELKFAASSKPESFVFKIEGYNPVSEGSPLEVLTGLFWGRPPVKIALGWDYTNIIAILIALIAIIVVLIITFNIFKTKIGKIDKD